MSETPAESAPPSSTGPEIERVTPLHDVVGTGRLESFSDGVMAVIITVMAFDLRPPSGANWTAVDHRLPTLLIYILSFTVIGIYLNNHHHLLRLTTTISAGVMWANLALLFWLSLTPVTTQ
jgi:uncharacterized membrane protein